MNNAETHIKVTGTAVTRAVETVATGAGFLASFAAYQSIFNIIGTILGAILTAVLIWYWIRKGNIAEREIILKEKQAEKESERLDDIASSYSSFLEKGSPQRRKTDDVTQDKIIDSILQNEQLMNALKSRIKNED